MHVHIYNNHHVYTAHTTPLHFISLNMGTGELSVSKCEKVT